MIYVHVPFCRSFCTYCDFFSEVAPECRKADDRIRQEALFEEFADALAAEVTSRAGEISDDVNTLYIGGGTPSVLPLSAFEKLLEALRRTGHGVPFEEFTVEVNPEDIVEKGYSYVEGLLELGVNRISMGVQSFDDAVLRFMNRRHDAATAAAAYGILEDAGVPDISIDLIFGLPQLSDGMWQETLKMALEISPKGRLPKHISSYQLSVEPGSALAGLVERGLWSEAPEEQCRRQYDILCDTLREAGYHHYEISNFALPGHEAVHNSAYWSHIPYVGFGPGAHSFVPLKRQDMRRQWNLPDIPAYIEAARRGDFSSICEGETLTPDQMALERLMLGLRTSAGLTEDYLRRNIDRHSLELALKAGNLVSAAAHGTESRLRIPESRFFVSDSIISDLA